MHKHAQRNLLSISELTPSGLSYLLTLARELRWRDADSHALSGKTVVLIFEKPSLRTRVTFEVAVRRLGGWPVLLGPEESCLGRRESIPDMARNLGLWVDGIVARVYRHTSLEELASFSAVPVVNALSDYEHPCQAIADLLTLQNVWGDFRGRRLVYVGDWNNVARSLWKASDLAGLDFRAVCPKPFAPPPEELVIWSSDLDAVKDADAIYTDVWASMGHETELQDRVPIFTPYQVNETLLARTGKSTLFMHCLQAHRGL